MKKIKWKMRSNKKGYQISEIDIKGILKLSTSAFDALPSSLINSNVSLK